MVASHTIAEVSRDHRGIVRGSADQIHHHGGERRVEVTMKIGKLKQPESLKGFRQCGQNPVLADHANIQKTAAHNFTDPEELKKC